MRDNVVKLFAQSVSKPEEVCFESENLFSQSERKTLEALLKRHSEAWRVRFTTYASSKACTCLYVTDDGPGDNNMVFSLVKARPFGTYFSYAMNFNTAKSQGYSSHIVSSLNFDQISSAIEAFLETGPKRSGSSLDRSQSPA